MGKVGTGRVGTGAAGWALAVAAGAVLAWRFSRRCTGAAAGQGSPAAGAAPAPVSGGASPPAAAERAGGAQAAPEEPVDGWTFSAADTAASEPPVEDQYIEDISVAAHAAPIDAGSEPSPWRLRIAPQHSGTQEKLRGEGSGAAEAAGAQDESGEGPGWSGDDGERLAGPDTGADLRSP